jgi:methylmalonyl-CoA mutase cobalamin-binding subunit
VPRLLEMGVAHVFGPGTSLDEIVAFLQKERQP